MAAPFWLKLRVEPCAAWWHPCLWGLVVVLLLDGRFSALLGRPPFCSPGWWALLGLGGEVGRASLGPGLCPRVFRRARSPTPVLGWGDQVA